MPRLRELKNRNRNMDIFSAASRFFSDVKMFGIIEIGLNLKRNF